MIKLDFNTYCKKLEFTKKDMLSLIENNGMTGWYKYQPSTSLIKEYASEIRKSDILIVIGIGGSYLGSKAVIDAMSGYFDNLGTEVIYAGTNLSSSYLNDLLKYIEGKSVCINLISKSGTTLEPNIAFDIIYNKLKDSEDISNKVFITTEVDSILHTKYPNFRFLEIPKNIGGRFSVFTACGLLPLAVKGIDIDMFLNGSLKGYDYYEEAYDYALIRHNSGKSVEAFVVYEEKLYMFTEWLKQLFAESHGKDYKGILPISIVNTRDLHSLGQFVQEGSRIMFETVLKVEKSNDITINDKSLNELNNIAALKVAEAHLQDKSESLIIEIDELNEYNLGMLMTFFFLSVSIGGFLLDINPFDQPGVKKYKDLLEKEI